MNKNIKVLLGVLVAAIIIAVGAFVYMKKHGVVKVGDTTKQSPAEVVLTPNFPKALVPEGAKLLSSNAVMSGKAENDTTTIESAKSVKELYDFYTTYVLKQGYLITNKSISEKFANIYGARADVDVNIVITQQQKNTTVTISYLHKNR